MANNFYTPSGAPATSAALVSNTIRTEFNSIEDGFDKVSPLTGNSELPLFVNTAETAQEAVSATTAISRLGLDADIATLSLPASTTISAFIKTLLDDASSSAARTTLGLTIGVNVQAYDALLGSISSLGSAADKMIYLTGVNTAAETALTSFARTILDDASAVAVLATLGITATATALNTAIANVVEDTTPQLGGELDCQAHSVGFTLQTATGDGTTTIDWKLGNKFKFTFGAQSDTFTFTAPTKPCNILLMLVQDAGGSRTATWPASVKWPSGVAPTLSTGANEIDIVSFFFDGTNYYGTESLNFS